MRSVSKVLASLLGLSLLAAAAHAAPAAKPSPSDRQVGPYKTALATLTLSAEQRAKTDALVTEAAAKYDEAAAAAPKKDAPADEKKAAMAKRADILKALRSAIEAELTADQKKAFGTALADAKKAARPAPKGDKKAEEAPAN